MAVGKAKYRLRFVPHRWTGPKNLADYDANGRRFRYTTAMSKRQAIAWRRLFSWFSQDIWFMQLQAKTNNEWRTIESWWPSPDGIQPPRKEISMPVIKKRGPGRPKLPRGQKLVTINVTITQEQKAILRKTFPNGDCSKFLRGLLDGELFAKISEEK